jgi:hypothetical protein
MTTYIFFENATTFTFTLLDRDGNQFGLIYPNGYYGLKLNYSPTFEKEYVFQSGVNTFTMWLSIYGEIQRIYPSNSVHLDVRAEEYNTRIQIFPPPIKTSNQVTPCCHLYGYAHNKLLITPIDNIYARVYPLIAPPVPDRSLRLDFV